MKVVTVTALFPQLRGGRAHQQGRGRGSTVQAAMGAAMRDLVKQKGLRKQRYSEFTATFTLATIEEETPKEVLSETHIDNGRTTVRSIPPACSDVVDVP